MNKRQLVDALAVSFETSKENAKAILETFIGTIKDQLLSGSEISIHKFGTFSIAKRASKGGYNPQTWEKITIEAYSTPVFKAGKTFKEEVKAKFSNK